MMSAHNSMQSNCWRAEIMKFRNPMNGYIEEKQYPALGALLFGGLYLIGSGLWAPFLIYLILAIAFLTALGPGGLLLIVIMNVTLAVGASSMIRESYLKKGWTEVGKEDGDGTARTGEAGLKSD